MTFSPGGHTFIPMACFQRQWPCPCLEYPCPSTEWVMASSRRCCCRLAPWRPKGSVQRAVARGSGTVGHSVSWRRSFPLSGSQFPNSKMRGWMSGLQASSQFKCSAVHGPDSPVQGRGLAQQALWQTKSSYPVHFWFKESTLVSRIFP